MKLRRIFAAFLAVVLLIDASPFGVIQAVTEETALTETDTVISAVDADRILHSATITVKDTCLARADQSTLGDDLPAIDNLFTTASGEFNKSGEAWNWFAYKVSVPEEGSYTLGVKTSGSKYDSYKLPLIVDGALYALQYTAKAQLVTVDVTLPAGEHTVVMFMPMPATPPATVNVWNDYHWCDIESVTVDSALTVSKPTAEEVEAAVVANHSIAAVDGNTVLFSAAVGNASGKYLEFNSRDAVKADMPYVESLLEDAPGQFNKTGEEWGWFAVQVTAPADGAYTLALQLQNCRNAPYYVPLYVNGQVYTLSYSATGRQAASVFVTLPAGEHTVVMFMPMPKNATEATGEDWVDYPWANPEIITVDAQLAVSKPAVEEVEACFPVDPVISAVDTGKILHSATIQVADTYLGRTDQETVGADQPTIMNLYIDASGQFNEAGQQWNWFAYKVTASAEGTYTLGVKTSGSKYVSYKLPMCVNGQVYTLEYTEQSQLVTADVTLPAGEHVVVMFMPMPAAKADITGNVWNDYHWCNVEGVLVDPELTASKPTQAEVEACFAPPVYSATDTTKVLWSAAVKHTEGAEFVERGDTTGLYADAPRIDNLLELAPGKLNAAGTEWPWIAYKVSVPAEGTYTLGVTTNSCKWANFKIPMVVNGAVYTLTFTAKAQTVTAEVQLPAGENVVTVFWPMPADESEVYVNEDWNTYLWANIASVTADHTLTVTAPTASEVEACFPLPVPEDAVIPAPDDNYILRSEAVKYTEGSGFLERDDTTGLYADDPRIDTLLDVAPGNFNASGTEWPWMAYKISVPADGTYTLGVTTNSAKWASFKLPMVVGGEVHTLTFTEKAQTVITEVQLPAGEHVVTVFWPMPADESEVYVNEDWNSYLWANIQSVTVDHELSVSKPTAAEVEACFPAVYTRVEAEDTEYVIYNNYNTPNESNSAASGGMLVGGAWNSTYKQTFEELENWLSFKGNAYVEYAVVAPADGEYDIRVAFQAGSNDKSIAKPYIAVVVNDTTYRAQFTKNWNQIDKVKLTVSLKEGLNIIRCTSMTTEQEIYTAKGWINHDFLDLDIRLTPVGRSSPVLLEAENSQYYNKLKVQAGGEDEAASGDVLGSADRSYITEQKLTLDQLTLDTLKQIPYFSFTVSAPQNGYYPIRVAMAGDGRLSQSTVGMLVDGQLQAVEYTRTDKTTKGAMVETLVYLTAGDHVITFTTPMPAAADPEANYSYYWANFDYMELYDGLVLADTQKAPTQEGDSPLYGQSALFVGDSITHSANSWASKIGSWYSMDWTNAGVSGASISDLGDKIIRHQLMVNAGKDYDYVILHGGMNDGYSPVGTVSDSWNVADFDTSTYAGALEAMLYYAYENFPGAKLGYIVNYATPNADSTTWKGTDDMSAYFAEGKKVCEKWGISYIDLYFGSTADGKSYSFDILQVDKAPQNFINNDANEIHLSNQGYQVITPYIAQWMETLTVKESPIPAANSGKHIDANDGDKVLYGGFTSKSEHTGDAAIAGLQDRVYTGMAEDNATIELLPFAKDMLGKWAFASIAVEAAQDGAYTFRVEVAAKAATQIGMLVDGEVYTLTYSKENGHYQFLEQTVSLTQGTHYITFTAAMPASDNELDGNAWDIYPWTNLASFVVDEGLQVLSKPSLEDVTAKLSAYKPFYTRVEAEDTEYVLYNNYSTPDESNAAASGGMLVGGAWNSTYQQTFEELEKWLSFKGNAYVEYAVVAPADGEYDIRVGFLAGSNDKSIAKPYIAVVVNDTTYRAQFTKNWNQIDKVKLTVSLKEGLNIIRCTSMTTEQEIYTAKGWINHDFLDLDIRLTPVGRSSPVLLEAENSQHFNKFTVQAGGETEAASGDVLGKSSRTYISGLKLTLDQIKQSNLRQVPYFSFTVTAPQNGYYPIRVAMAGDGRLKNSTVGMLVDKEMHAVEYTRTDKTTKGAMVETLVYLTAGDHVITFTTPMPAAADPEANYSYFWANYDYVMLYDGLVLAKNQKAPTPEAEYTRLEVEEYAMFNMNKNNGTAVGDAYYRSSQSMAQMVESGIDGSKTPFMELTAQANKAGSYVLYIAVSVGMTEGNTLDEADTQMAVEVNGTLYVKTLHAAKSTNYTILPLQVELKKGVNTIRLSHLSSDAHYGGTTWIDFDYIEMPAWVSGEVAFAKSGETMEAETARYDGFGESTGDSYSGGRYLGRVNYDTVAELNITFDTLDPANLNGLPYVTYRIFAEKAGTYAVTVGFAAGLTNYTAEETKQGVAASFVAIVNGETKQRVEFVLSSSSVNMTRLVMLELKEGENEVTFTGTTTEYVIDRLPRNDETYRLVWIDQDYLLLSEGLSNQGQNVDAFDIEDSSYNFGQLVPKASSQKPSQQPGGNTPAPRSGMPAAIWILIGIGVAAIIPFIVMIVIGKKRKENKE